MSDDSLLNGTGAPDDQPPAGNDTPPAGNDTPPAGGFDVNAFMSEGWRDCIPEDLRDRSEWSRVSNVQDVFKNYISAQQTISKSVRIPDAGADCHREPDPLHCRTAL